jgi:glycosyltransferase involved in cell wall biosynthesis
VFDVSDPAEPVGLARSPVSEANLASLPRICILSLSAIADDPRVHRQGDAFHRAGWRVAGVGLPGASSRRPSWLVEEGAAAAGREGSGEASRTGGEAAFPLWRRALRRLPASIANAIRIGARPVWRARMAQRLLAVRLHPEAAFKIYWSWPAVGLLYAQARTVSADVWLANDWTCLPLAARLALERGGTYGYDTHEFALEEYAEHAAWRILRRPMVSVIEGRSIRGASVVSAVSAGIAEELQRIYALPATPLVIRNTPSHVPVAARRTGGRIRVLYHGIVARGRGLEATIDSVALWRPEFDLTIRGPGDPAYLAGLTLRIKTLGLESRVRLAPSVPMTDLVAEAAPFDVGFFGLPAHSRHNVFALPNKFFEYAMAGLALCVSDLPEMARLVRQHDMGVTMPGLAPAEIAAAVNSLDQSAIDRYRTNALAASRKFCWEEESARLIEAYRDAVRVTARPLPEIAG